MCKPSCCNNNDSGGSGLLVLAAVIVVAAVYVIGKIAHVVARGVSEAAHVGAEVFHVVALVTVSVLGVAAAAGLAVVAVWVWRRYGHHLRPPRPSARRRARVLPMARPGCLSCGGSGRVLSPARPGVLALGACKVCAPVLADPAPDDAGKEAAPCARS